MRRRQLLKWVGTGVWHSLSVFFGWYFMWPYFTERQGDIFGYGSVVAFNAILVINLRILIEARHWNFFLIASVILSVACYPAVTIICAQWLVTDYFNNAPQFRAYLQLFAKLPTFLGTVVVTVLALTPDVIIKSMKPTVRSYKQVRHRRKTNPIVA